MPDKNRGLLEKSSFQRLEGTYPAAFRKLSHDQAQELKQSPSYCLMGRFHLEKEELAELKALIGNMPDADFCLVADAEGLAEGDLLLLDVVVPKASIQLHLLAEAERIDPKAGEGGDRIRLKLVAVNQDGLRRLREELARRARLRLAA